MATDSTGDFAGSTTSSPADLGAGDSVRGLGKDDLFSLVGKRALITGATGGIGGAIACAYAKRGARVFLSGRREEVLKGLAQKINTQEKNADVDAASGPIASIYPCDLSDRAAIDSMSARITNEHGGIDILVNNAGLTRDGLSLNMKDDAWDDVLAVNLTNVFRLTRGFLRAMLKQRWGRIIMIGSVVGFTGNKGQVNYVSSKAGLVGMVKGLAQELASRSITVNCIAPGFIDTAMTADLGEDVRRAVLSSIPAGRYGSVADIAHAALYLASCESGYTTGQTLHVNGGMAMY